MSVERCALPRTGYTPPVGSSAVFGGASSGREDHLAELECHSSSRSDLDLLPSSHRVNSKQSCSSAQSFFRNSSTLFWFTLCLAMQSPTCSSVFESVLGPPLIFFARSVKNASASARCASSQ